MSCTLHLKRSSLIQTLHHNANNGLIFIKRRPINFISDILTSIPLDVCILINTYSFEYIRLQTNINYDDELIVWNETEDCYMDIDYQNPINIYVRFYDGVMFTVRTNGDDINDGPENYNVDIMNKFMKRYYGKKDYIQYKSKLRDHHDIIFSKHHVVVIDNKSKDFYNVDVHKPKQFKYMIVMLKCILRSIQHGCR